MTRTLDDYRRRFARAALERSASGVLVVRLHTDDGPLVWDEVAHRELPGLWADIAQDDENRVIVLTGTGDAFCAVGSANPFREHERGWEKITSEGERLLTGLLDIPVPMIGVVNGPAHIHAELAVLCDVVLASDSTTFSDGHFPGGVVPGDGVHVVWPELLGENRGRHFLLTGAELSAAEALRLGVVAEVHPADEVLARGLAVAEQLATQEVQLLRLTRSVLTRRWKRRLAADLAYGLAAEGVGLL